MTARGKDEPHLTAADAPEPELLPQSSNEGARAGRRWFVLWSPGDGSAGQCNGLRWA